jgi:hypothetical protein
MTRSSKTTHSPKKSFGSANLKVLALLLVIFLGIFLFFNYKKQRLKTRQKTAKAFVYSYKPGKRADYWIFYRFTFNNVEVKGSHKKDLPVEKISYLIDHKIPLDVIFDSLDPQNAHLLLEKEDFEEFDMPFPDSMNKIYEGMIKAGANN